MISCKSGDAFQEELNHPLRNRSDEEKFVYVNTLAALLASGNNNGSINLKFAAAIVADFGLELKFEKLISSYCRHRGMMDVIVMTQMLKKSDSFTLLILDATMIQPEIFAAPQKDALDFLKKLHLRLTSEEKNQEWYPAMIGFASALAKSNAVPELLTGTTTKFYIPPCWAHILKFKRLLTDETAVLPELCRIFTPGSVGMMFQSGNFITDEKGEPRLIAAVFKQSRAAVEFLLMKGADINTVDKEAMTALDQWGFLLSSEFFDFMLDHGAKVSHDTISFSLMMNKPVMIRSIMQHGIEIPADGIMQGGIDMEAARAYLENGGDPNLKNVDGHSWIDTEIILDNQEIVTLLKEFGAVPSPDVRPLQEEMDILQKFIEKEEGKTGKDTTPGIS